MSFFGVESPERQREAAMFQAQKDIESGMKNSEFLAHPDFEQNPDYVWGIVDAMAKVDALGGNLPVKDRLKDFARALEDARAGRTSEKIDPGTLWEDLSGTIQERRALAA